MAGRPGVTLDHSDRISDTVRKDLGNHSVLQRSFDERDGRCRVCNGRRVRESGGEWRVIDDLEGLP